MLIDKYNRDITTIQNNMSKNSILKKRILEYLNYKGVTKYESYQKTGVSNGVLSQGSGLSEDNLMKYLSYYSDINTEWLLTGKGPMFSSVKAYKSDSSEPSLLNEPQVPLINFGAIAGEGSNDFSISQKDVQENYVVPDFRDIQFMIRVQGSSMYPKYIAGDIIACRILKQKSFIQWNKVHVIATREQGVIVKRLKKGSTNDSYCCISDNKEYDPFEIPKEDCFGIALVVGVIRVE